MVHPPCHWQQRVAIVLVMVRIIEYRAAAGAAAGSGASVLLIQNHETPVDKP